MTMSNNLQEERTQEHIDFLTEFVSMKSISSDPAMRETSHNTASFLMQQLLTLGADAEIIHQDAGNPAVIAKLGEEEDVKTILIYGHYDVQPASKEDGWDTEPFELTEKDGFLYGRGVTDDKGPISSALFAVKEMMEDGQFPVNLRFIYEGMEESGSVGFEDIVSANLDFFGKVDGVVVIDNYWLGTDRPCLTYGLRGMAYMMIEVSGPKQDLHSGIEGGTTREPMTDLINLMGKLQATDGMPMISRFGDDIRPITPEEAALYEDIEFTLEEYKSALGVSALNSDDAKTLLMKKWRYPTFSIHGIEGAFSGPGSKTVIPGKVTGKISMRLVPDQDPKTIIELVKEQIHTNWSVLNSPNKLEVSGFSGDWWLGDPSNYLFVAADNAIQEVWNQKPMYTREGGSIPIVPFMEKVFDAPAMMLAIGQSTDSAHSQNEKIRILNLINGKEVIKHMLLNLGNL